MSLRRIIGLSVLVVGLGLFALSLATADIHYAPDSSIISRVPGPLGVGLAVGGTLLLLLRNRN